MYTDRPVIRDVDINEMTGSDWALIAIIRQVQAVIFAEAGSGVSQSHGAAEF